MIAEFTAHPLINPVIVLLNFQVSDYDQSGVSPSQHPEAKLSLTLINVSALSEMWI